MTGSVSGYPTRCRARRLGGAYRFNREAEGLRRGSADLLVGRTRGAGESPLRAAGGVRYFREPSLQLELSVIGSLSKRTRRRADDPLAPIEPAISALFGVRFG